MYVLQAVVDNWTTVYAGLYSSLSNAGFFPQAGIIDALCMVDWLGYLTPEALIVECSGLCASKETPYSV